MERILACLSPSPSNPKILRAAADMAGLREEWYTEEDTNVEVEWIPLSLDEESPKERIQRLIRDAEASDPSGTENGTPGERNSNGKVGIQ